MRKGKAANRLVSHDPGQDRVESWLEDWLGPHTLVSLRPFEIDAKSLTVWKSRYRTTKKYKEAFAQHQSLFHSHLKFLGRLWLEDEALPEAAFSSDVEYEVRMYFPDPRLAGQFAVYGRAFDFTRPQVLLPKGRRDVIADFGKIICADVFGRDTTVEIGRTSPYNLCMPGLSKLVGRSVWIPFPSIPFKADSDPDEMEVDVLSAYEIKVELDSDFVDSRITTGSSRPSRLRRAGG